MAGVAITATIDDNDKYRPTEMRSAMTHPIGNIARVTLADVERASTQQLEDALKLILSELEDRDESESHA